ncbi:MAG: hypothetical protein EBZ68_03430 [Actinobacteria bacterium]|nr:hypothetical protein [Actinomycetota bacterium]
MHTVYGVTLIAPKPADAAREAQMRESVGALILPWLETTWPETSRTNTVQVNARSAVTDKVFRVDVSEQHRDGEARQVTSVSMYNTQRGDLCIDIRREVRPTGTAVLPRERTELPPTALTALVANIVRELRIRDAQNTLSPSISKATSELDGQAVAALIDAPSRRLPVIVESTVNKAKIATGSETARVLTSTAHVYHLATAEAERGFNQVSGQRKASSSWVIVAWPGLGKAARLDAYPQQDDERLVHDVLAAAVGALPVPPRPTSRPAQLSNVPIQQVVANTSSPEVGELRRKNQELEQRINNLQDDYDALHDNLTTTEHLTAKMAEDRDRYLNQLTDLLALRNDPKEWSSTQQVIERARRSFAALDFHESLSDRLGKTSFPPATNQRLFGSLLELNNLAARLRRGDIEPHLFNTYCTEKFNFAPSVSDNAINKFGQDYTIEWNGKSVQLGPHIRCNEARIYFYLDQQQRRVVIGHVGEHLRDKSTN